MIEIYVGGDRLDLPKTDVKFHFGNSFFTGKLIQDFSIDFDIPRTSHNDRVINPTGALYRNQMFGYGIRCQVLMGSERLNCSMEVVKFDKNTITIALFQEIIPAEIMDKKLHDVIHDDASTIVDFPLAMSTQQATTDVGLFKFDMTGKVEVIYPSNYLPSITIRKLFQMLTSALGVQFPPISGRYYLTATNREVSPYLEKQTFRLYKGSGNEFQFSQSPTNESVVGSVNGTKNVKLTFTRKCTAKIRLELFPQTAYPALAEIYKIKSSGDELLMRVSKNSAPYPDKLVDEKVFNFVDGDAIYIIPYGFSVNVDIDYSDVEHSEELDKDMPLISNANILAYIGVIHNLADVTIKQLLTSICWQLGKSLNYDNGVITFVDALDKKRIDANITSYSSKSDAMGRVTSLQDATESKLTSKVYVNGFLDDEKVLFKSSFMYPKNSKVLPNYPSIPVYEKDEEGVYRLSKLKGIPISESAQIGGRVQLTAIKPTPNAVAMLSQISKVLEIEGDTFDDIMSYRYIVIDGIKYAVVKGDRDVNSGKTHFTALQISEEFYHVLIENNYLFDDASFMQFDDGFNVGF